MFNLPNVTAGQQGSFPDTSDFNFDGCMMSDYEGFFRHLEPWINSTDFMVTVPASTSDERRPRYRYFGYENTTCPSTICSTRAWCEPFYKAFFRTIIKRNGEQVSDDIGGLLTQYLQTYYAGRSAPNPFFSCPLYITQVLPVDFMDACRDFGYDAVNMQVWRSANVADNLIAFRDGGLDDQFVYWPGLRPDSYYDRKDTFVQALGREFLDVRKHNCDLRKVCTVPLRCEEVGSKNVLGLGGSLLMRSKWAFFALTAIQNLNSQLSNTFNALDSAAIRTILDTFSIDQFFPTPNPQTDLTNSLQNLASIVSIVSWFAPITPYAEGAAVLAKYLPQISDFYTTQLVEQSPPDLA